MFNYFEIPKCSPKRSLEEVNDITGENFDEESILNIPIHALDHDKMDNSPWMKYLVIRKESVYIDCHRYLIELNFN